jgi:predicted NBD/HSP70 family sugar kinase
VVRAADRLRARSLDGLLDELGAVRQQVWAIGIGAPGPVEFGEGRTVAPPIMPGWDGVRIPEWFEDYPGAAVLVDNDVNVMALGEYWTEWRTRTEDLLFVKVGTGIGAGIIAAGRLLRGADGTAGDIGHIRLADHPDTRCRCGNTGCVESLAGGAALARQLADLGFEATNSRDVVALVRAGNTFANRLVRDAGRMIGEVLAGAVNSLNPSVIVVGGDIAAADEQLFAGIREVVYERSTALATRGLQIVPSALGDRAGLVGASVLATEWVLAADAIDRRLESDPERGGLSA